MLDQVKDFFLRHHGLQDNDIERVMSALLSGSVDAADVYFQSSHFESWSLEGGIVKEGKIGRASCRERV